MSKRVRQWVILGLGLFMLAACGGGGGGGGGGSTTTTPTAESQWDQMIWDQDNWH